MGKKFQEIVSNGHSYFENMPFTHITFLRRPDTIIGQSKKTPKQEWLYYTAFNAPSVYRNLPVDIPDVFRINNPNLNLDEADFEFLNRPYSPDNDGYCVLAHLEFREYSKIIKLLSKGLGVDCRLRDISNVQTPIMGFYE
ncbi:hypothetical protein HYT25_04655 [Candidatus Pacearchaeota archaeon]|nr:hypothetical protein [Candidatus Pacearchaeota archaeon]